MTLHEWFYQIAAEVCLDREYMYYVFANYFSVFVKELYSPCHSGGSMIIYGVKSDYDAHVYWNLPRKTDFIGSGAIECEYRLVHKNGGTELPVNKAEFELAGGTSVTISQPR